MYKLGSRNTIVYRSSPGFFIYFLVFHPQHNFGSQKGAGFEHHTANPSVEIFYLISLLTKHVLSEFE